MDADHLALNVEKGTARIAADQGAVGFQKVRGVEQDSPDPHDGPAMKPKAPRMTQGDAPLARLLARGMAQFDEGKGPTVEDS